MARGQHASGTGLRSRPVQAALAGTLVVAAGVAVWLGTDHDDSPGRAVSSAGTPSATQTAPAAPSPAPTTSAAPAAAPAALSACARSVHAAEAAVAAAQHGVDDWAQHLQAYRYAVAAGPAASTAPAAWSRTEASGPRDAAQWTAASTGYTATRGACGSVVAQAGQAAAAPAKACAARAAAADTAVRSAGALMTGWADHLQQTEERRSGRMTDSRANALFAAASRQAPAQLAALQRDRDALTRAPACTA